MESKVYTMEDWQRDKELPPAIGQEVSAEVFSEQLNCVPPAYYSHNIMQVGEPYGTDKETYKSLFTTYVRNEKGTWNYAGHCLYGKTENRKTLFED